MANDNAFWNFSLDVYGRDGVADACLQLQSAYELDVNILLFCLWAAATGTPPFTETQMAEICDLVEGWHKDVVRPLRSIRNRMKENPHGAPVELAATLRNDVKSNELTAEKIEQEMLFAGYSVNADIAKDSDQILISATGNIETYLAHLGLRADAEEVDAIQVILGAVTSN